MNQDDWRHRLKALSAPIDRGTPQLVRIGSINIDPDFIQRRRWQRSVGPARSKLDLCDRDFKGVEFPLIVFPGQKAEHLAIEGDAVSLRLVRRLRHGS